MQGTAFTVGIEEEYQLVDPRTGALRDHASVLRGEDWTGEISPELQESTIEIGTPVCSTAADAGEHLRRLRFQSSTVAQAQGVGIVAAGLHPFARWQGHRRPALERYSSIEARYGRIAKDEHIFGMHVHVAVPDDVDRLRVTNITRHYLPHLLALSCSSAFFEGGDTGFASFRTIMWRRWPNSGAPPRFASTAEFDRFVDLLLDAGVMADKGNIYWSLRPHARYPTVEFRVTDVCPNVRDAEAIAALCRALVYAAATGVLDDAGADMGAVLEQELIRVNEWRVARDGLGARVIDATNGREHLPVRTAIRRLVDRVARCADDLGDSAALTHVETILERGNASERMRRQYQDGASLEDLVRWLVDETLVGTGLDRRVGQREPVS